MLKIDGVRCSSSSGDLVGKIMMTTYIFFLCGAEISIRRPTQRPSLSILAQAVSQFHWILPESWHGDQDTDAGHGPAYQRGSRLKMETFVCLLSTSNALSVVWLMMIDRYKDGIPTLRWRRVPMTHRVPFRQHTVVIGPPMPYIIRRTLDKCEAPVFSMPPVFSMQPIVNQRQNVRDTIPAMRFTLYYKKHQGWTAPWNP